ncbi:MAG: hypothetical protein ACI9MR_003970, partial [Myxococcota bacterium]
MKCMAVCGTISLAIAMWGGCDSDSGVVGTTTET